MRAARSRPRGGTTTSQTLPLGGSLRKAEEMKHRFPVIAVLAAALVVLAVPGSSTASMFPAGHQFEITGSGESLPRLGTSLGSCTITKIAGTVPASPKNLEAVVPVAVPTVGTCTAGTSLTLSGKWTLAPAGHVANLIASAEPGGETIVMRFSSLPGCKLRTFGSVLGALWMNGTTTPSLLTSAYHAQSTRGFTWANDGGTCALAGQAEAVSYSNESGSPENKSGSWATATDLTSPTTPITVGN